MCEISEDTINAPSLKFYARVASRRVANTIANRGETKTLALVILLR